MNVVQAQNGYIQDDRVKVSGIKTQSQLIPLSIAEKTTSRSYTDGLGRIIQTIVMKGSPQQKDIVQPIAFDQLGRQTTGYLPYAASTSDASYRANALSTEQPAFYQSGNNLIAQDASPYSQQVFENSPLQRILNEGSVGVGFQPGQHRKTYDYRTNQSGDQVINWGTNAVNSGYYAAAKLSVSQVEDEDGAKVMLFTDLDGKLILKKALANETVNGVFESYFETYYLYNEAGTVSHVIPPKAVSLMKSSSNWSLSQTAVSNLIFQYQYDQLGRLVQKSVPGSGKVYIIYDPLDRPVLMQDENLRSANKWNYIKYDLKGHAISQGIYTDAVAGHIGQANMQAYVNTLNYSTVYYEERSAAAASGYYTNVVFPTSSIEPLAYSYYDNYDLNLNGSPDYSYAVQGLEGESVPVSATRGMPTMVRKRSIGSGLSNIWLLNVVFYDKFGRVIQKQSNNHLNYTAEVLTDVSTSSYNFEGIPVLNKVSKLAGMSATTVQTGFSYDHMSRLTSVSQKYNSGANSQIASYEYNEIGQLVKKNLQPGANNPDHLVLSATNSLNSGQALNAVASQSITMVDGFYAANGSSFSALISANSLQTIDFRYNIRGQLTSINNSTLSNDGGLTNSDANDVFGMQLLYDQADANLGNTANYSGRLSAVKWMSKDGNGVSSYERSYKYSYDLLNRLTAASYAERTGGTGSFNRNIDGFSESGIKYDQNGNLLSLQRNSSTQGTNSHTQIDNLTYSYNSSNPNQLSAVTDGTGSNYTGAGFMIYAGGNSTGTYGYDASGNLTADPYKGITLSYNVLNRTDQITVSSGAGKYIKYTYDAGGTLLRKQVFSSGATTLVTDYVDGFVYNNNNSGNVLTLAYFGMPEGRVRNDQGVLKREYVITDQQGNARVSVEDNGSGVAVVRQENSYYAFGMLLANSPVGILSDGNKHLYNGGAEWQNDYGNLPDYQQTFYRNYDAAIGRFVGIDPLAEVSESLTGYQYANNNPIMFNDPLGDLPRPQPMANDLGSDGGGGGGGGGGILGNGRYFHEKWLAKMSSSGDHGEWNDFLGQRLPTNAQVAQTLAQYGTTISPSLYGAILNGNSTFDFSKDRTYQINTKYYEPELKTYGVNVSLINQSVEKKSVSWYESGGKANWTFGTTATGFELFSGISRLGSNFKFYSETSSGRVFQGNQYVKTMGVSKIANLAGKVSLGVGVALDAFGVANYYDDPNSTNSVHPGKAILNTGVGVFGLYVNPPAGVLYFGIDSFHPGGWPGFFTNLGSMQNEINQQTNYGNWSRIIPFGPK